MTWSKGVTVNVVVPGFIKTDMTRVLGEAFMEKVACRVPIRRPGETQDIANVGSWLSSDESGHVTGHVLMVDDGRHLVRLVDEVQMFEGRSSVPQADRRSPHLETPKAPLPVGERKTISLPKFVPGSD